MCSIIKLKQEKKNKETVITNYGQNWLELSSGIIVDQSVLVEVVHHKSSKNKNPWLWKSWPLSKCARHGFIYRYVTTIVGCWWMCKFLQIIKNERRITSVNDNNDEANGLSWTKMPMLVSIKLFKLLSFDTRKVARLVCSDWKFIVDKMVGVSVALDEYRDSEDFLDFVQDTKLEQLFIGNMTQIMDHIELRHPRALRRVTCQGSIEKDWFYSKLLGQCKNLNKLVLKGEFLSKMMAVTSRTNYEKIVCPNLETLEIISPRGNVFPRHFAMSYYLNVFHDSINDDRQNNNHLASPRNNEDSIQQTMHMILTTIQSPRLKLLHIYVYENFFIHKSPDYWKDCPFQQFLQTHRHSLRELYLPEFQGNRSTHFTSSSYNLLQKNQKSFLLLPRELTSLEVCIHRFHHKEGNPQTEQNQDFIKRLLKNQTKLKDLTMELHKMRTFWFMDVLQSVVDNTRGTLRVLKIQIIQADEDDCVLSGSVLGDLVCLEELKLEGDALTSHVLTLTDFQWLPKSLKKILTMFMRIEQTDFTSIHLFEQLKYIELNNLVLSPPPPPPQPPINLNEVIDDDDESPPNPSSTSQYYSQLFTKILQQLLSHRSLDHLGVNLSKSAGGCENLRKLMETLGKSSDNSNVIKKRLNYMPNYYGIVVAHQYEIDDKFDLYRPTNRENIFADDLMLYVRPQKDTDNVTLVEVKVELERRETSEYYDLYDDFEDGGGVDEDFSDASSDMPSLHSISCNCLSDDDDDNNFSSSDGSRVENQQSEQIYIPLNQSSS